MFVYIKHLERGTMERMSEYTIYFDYITNHHEWKSIIERARCNHGKSLYVYTKIQPNHWKSMKTHDDQCIFHGPNAIGGTNVFLEKSIVIKKASVTAFSWEKCNRRHEKVARQRPCYQQGRCLTPFWRPLPFKAAILANTEQASCLPQFARGWEESYSRTKLVLKSY